MRETWHECGLGLESEGINHALIYASDLERDFRHERGGDVFQLRWVRWLS